MNEVFSIRPSMKVAYIESITYFCFFFIATIILAILNSVTKISVYMDFNLLFPMSLILFLITMVLILKSFIKVLTTKYTLTSTSLVIQTGFINIVRENLELYRIVDITAQEPFYYRMFGLANIILHTIDRTDPIIILQGIENSKTIEEEIKISTAKKKPTVIETQAAMPVENF